MKRLSLLFAFVGFFAMTNVSAQSAKYCVFPDGTCILCPSDKTCNAKSVKTCSPAEVAACKKIADKNTCQKTGTTATATTVANKKAENTCCGLPVSCCAKTTGEAVKTANTKMACSKPATKSCQSSPTACSKPKATSTEQLAEKMH